MSLELPPCIADWLSVATYGVNALLSGIPRDAGDSLPPNVTVVDEVRNGWVGRKTIPVEMVPAGAPRLAVYQSGEAAYPHGRMQRAAGGGGVLEGTATYLILYMTRKSDTAAASSDARYTLRATLNSLILLHDARTAQSSRTRNGASLTSAISYKMSTLLEERGDVLVTGGVLAEFNVRELVQTIT